MKTNKKLCTCKGNENWESAAYIQFGNMEKQRIKNEAFMFKCPDCNKYLKIKEIKV